MTLEMRIRKVFSRSSLEFAADRSCFFSSPLKVAVETADMAHGARDGGKTAAESPREAMRELDQWMANAAANENLPAAVPAGRCHLGLSSLRSRPRYRSLS